MHPGQPPNTHYDLVKGVDLWHMYLDLWCAADELGLEVMLNEPHQMPRVWCRRRQSCWTFWHGKPSRPTRSRNSQTGRVLTSGPSA
jgi:hypothetical protein